MLLERGDLLSKGTGEGLSGGKGKKMGELAKHRKLARLKKIGAKQGREPEFTPGERTTASRKNHDRSGEKSFRKKNVQGNTLS